MIIRHIFASNRGSLHFKALAGVTPCEYPDKLYLSRNCRVILSYLILKTARSYLHSSEQNWNVTDRWTDMSAVAIWPIAVSIASKRSNAYAL